MTELRTNVVGGLLGLYAQTSLHPGAGTALGTVDLPVQRERHTHWPTVAASALKGILRDACREKIAARADLDALDRHDDEEAEGDRPAKRVERKGSRRERADATLELDVVFGPPTAGSSEFAGALSVTDARLLAFPVRSLKGVFAWVSCPAVLERLERDAALAGQAADWQIPAVAVNEVLVPPGCPCSIGEHVVLEEFEFKKGAGDTTALGKWVAEHLLSNRPEFQATRARFLRQFLLLSDDDFTHFARHATEVSARIGLNYDSKTVKGGALFYQEFLPPETLMYSVVLANAARARSGGGKDAAGVLRFLTDHLPGLLQVGGDETTGKGYCATCLTVAK
jgi:CRISPR-associated protein Cmr4